MVNTSAVLLPENTLAPAATPVPTPVPAVTQSPQPMESHVPIAGVDTMYDEMGEYVSGAAHFQRYLTYENIQVYEQNEDTFLDAVVINSYPQPLICALDVAFFDEEGEELASARVQTRDGQYVLHLAPGETVIFAQIDTDTTLTDKEFDLVYNESLGVLPG
ncbi:MAG: hypothetical protein VB049_09100 [Candidatus Pelethousia sp.]|nr:hypothetical protein [Candidatus Pelethousia sp.]